MKEWNVRTHGRKFMKVAGRWREDGEISRQEQQADLMFWGEWEPESLTIRRFPRSTSGMPLFLQLPFWVPPPAHKWRQNTDPYIFGTRFRYSNCLQNSKKGPLRTQRLAAGSIILFGSTLFGEFVLDTVFVVASGQTMAYDLLPSLHKDDITFHAVVAEVLYRTPGQRTLRHRLYSGATPATPINGMFSFFPCLPYDEVSHGFARPRISLPGFVNPKKRQGAKFKPIVSLDEGRQVWKHVVEQVRKQDLLIGVYAETPSAFESVDEALRVLGEASEAAGE